ncbi:MAG: tellurite methyltransferase [bacterium]|jgi:tellurite methyltransferase
MSNEITSKWNSRYAYSGKPLPPPAQVLSRGERWLPKGDSLSALDLACGRAANAHYLASRGFKATAWDISETVITEISSRHPKVLAEIAVRNVVDQPPMVSSFDVIVVTRFLSRDICPAIQAALKPGGVLFYQTFTRGLSNKEFLLADNELLSLFKGLHLLEYHEPEPDEFGKAEARLIARRSMHD